jgi:hypothetical protein
MSIQSQYSRETTVEGYIEHKIRAKHTRNVPSFIEKFKSFKENRPVPEDINWEQMKKKFGWGFKKGSAIDPLITWIYLRPDIKREMDKEVLSVKYLLKVGIFNEHFFIVEKRAIDYLKTHCTQIITRNEDEDPGDENGNDVRNSNRQPNDDSQSESSSIDYQTLKRQKRVLGIDDMAEEVWSKKKK